MRVRELKTRIVTTTGVSGRDWSKTSRGKRRRTRTSLTPQMTFTRLQTHFPTPSHWATTGAGHQWLLSSWRLTWTTTTCLSHTSSSPSFWSAAQMWSRASHATAGIIIITPPMTSIPTRWANSWTTKQQYSVQRIPTLTRAARITVEDLVMEVLVVLASIILVIEQMKVLEVKIGIIMVATQVICHQAGLVISAGKPQQATLSISLPSWTL